MQLMSGWMQEGMCSMGMKAMKAGKAMKTTKAMKPKCTHRLIQKQVSTWCWMMVFMTMFEQM